MNKFIFLLFFLTFCFSISAQERPVRQLTKNPKFDNNRFGDSLDNNSNSRSKKVLKNEDATIDLYKFISHKNDTTYLDTTLAIKKDYKFNYLRKDDFDLLPFSNMGQTYNTLSYDFSDTNLMPDFAAQARQFNFKKIEDIYYYYVPTPLTELMYKTAFQQGQLLESFFTVNTSKQFNFSIGYKGLRSLGKYQHILTSTGNFYLTTNFKTKNNRYNFRGHVVMQDVMQEENGGIREEDIINFESGNVEFLDRSVFDPLFENAHGEIRGKRFHLDHSYNIIQQKDTLQTNILKVENTLTYRDKYYDYIQSSQNENFGDAFTNSIFDKVTLEDFYAEANIQFLNNNIGRLKTGIGYRDINYGYNTLVSINGNDIPNRLTANVFSFIAEYENTIGKFNLNAKAGINIAGDFEGNYIDAKASYNIDEDIKVIGGLNINSRLPNYNFLLYQSDYLNYNWSNSFKNVQTKQLSFDILSNKLANVSLDYTSISNYTYFYKSSPEEFVRPIQTENTLNYFRVKINKEIRYGKFALDNTIKFQKAIDGNGILNIPQLITRNTVYYSNHFFKRALFLQTGITLNYFTKYNMNAYDPVLGEFYVQNETEIGGFPRLDFFINAKVRQTRIFLKAEHFNSSFTGYNYYSAPNYPYRDFIVRFGLVWNFFL